jgi:hypothetical protein
MDCTGFRVLLLAAAATVPGTARPQAVEVHAQIAIVQTHVQKAARHSETPEAVLWLKPLDPPASFLPPSPGRFRMAQKDKSFQPHLLVVPIGSIVAFPNLDPFFHNVFSQFNGQRFDLGLYEAGSTRDVRFDHEGVSYIFCNIHPEMSAVIITVATPWYAISSGGTILLRGVPPGMYRLRVWASGANARQLDRLTRTVSIGPDSNNLGVISIETDARPETHRNKFGNAYPPDNNPIY